ncbi:MAG TPA: 30S ribosome-binding factor RbfA [Gammaproteobacteria bacterium]|nr:30S ribosome-binding factor RbfA [Gammaproteobacteria bacterium]
MAKDFPRTRRIGEQLQRELAELIRDEINDPRIGMVTVSAVEVTRDLAHAKVFVAVLGADAEQIAASLEALKSAAGFLRKLLGQRLRLRTVPALHFQYDDSFDRGARLSQLIHEAVSRDQRDGDDS